MPRMVESLIDIRRSLLVQLDAAAERYDDYVFTFWGCGRPGWTHCMGYPNCYAVAFDWALFVSGMSFRQQYRFYRSVVDRIDDLEDSSVWNSLMCRLYPETYMRSLLRVYRSDRG